MKFIYISVSILLIIFLLYIFFMYVYNNEQASQKKKSLPVVDNIFITLSREKFQNKKAELLLIKTGVLLNDEQYSNIINIYSNQTEKTVFLTFDDGPSNTVTPLILDLLHTEKIKATFFVLGTNVNRYPDILKREFLEGHFIGNHGYSHQYSEIYENSETILNDYNLCEQAIRNVLNSPNYSCKVYRFPGGSNGGRYHEIKANSKDYLKENHIAYLDWNALTYDAEGTPTRESIIENLQATVGNKQVVVLLMHDSSSKILTYDTLPEVISFFRENGYVFKTLYDVL